MLTVSRPSLAIAILLLLLFALLTIRPLRRRILSIIVFRQMARRLSSSLSDIQPEIMQAGSSWIEADLISGKPDFDRIRRQPYPKCSADEQAFLDGKVTELCRMSGDHEIQENGDLPGPVWEYLKREHFFGMVTPKENGGLGFSAIGHSEVIVKLASHSPALAITVMVPNSLGTTELILRYGTAQQKERYLPLIARGEEIVCFALTEPATGTDATAIQSSGELFRAENGELCVTLNFDKRYITLSPMSTLIGLVFTLRDPERLLGKGIDIGITCALVPSASPGITIGARHNPMGVAFQNGPISGRNVVVSIDQLIGGLAGAGKAWGMLMEWIGAGRCISLPAFSTGAAKAALRTVSAYCAVRRQSGVAIGNFEAVQERLARITGLTYMMDAARVYTMGAVDSGLRPNAISAIAKCLLTEFGRLVINDTMDVLAGAGVAMGPRNRIARHYMACPITIAAEGANIGTRSFIFGQVATRSHPYVFKEIKALIDADLSAFDRALWGHIGHIFRNTLRSLFLSLSRGLLAKAPAGPTARYYRKLAWASASFAVFSDLAMGLFGDSLRWKESLSGRLADILSWMYLGTATLRRYEAEGEPAEKRDVLDWSMQFTLAGLDESFNALLANFHAPLALAGAFVRYPIAWWARLNRIGRLPDDRLAQQVAAQIQRDNSLRDALTTGIVVSIRPGDAGDQMEQAFRLACQSALALTRIAAALPGKCPTRLIGEALDRRIITLEEAELLKAANSAAYAAIQVDSVTKAT